VSEREGDEWDEAFADAPDKQHSDEQPQPMYPSVEAWVVGYFSQIIRRPRKTQTCWCPEWWQHAEAVARLEALWRAWEFLRLDGTTGPSVWWRDHLEPHLGLLLDIERSPFAECGEDRGHNTALDDILPPLKIAAAPPGWWGDDADEEEQGDGDGADPDV
jgi:Domain of unknown function (DUF4913)